MPQTKPSQHVSLPTQLIGAASLFAVLTLLFDIRWHWAFLIMAAILAHEYGHLLAARLCRVPTGGILLLPFGAVTATGKRPTWAECPISLAGPLLGGAFAIPFWLGYLVTDDARFAGFAGAICALNLTNLLPLKPLDGGKVLGTSLESVSPLLALAFVGCTTVLVMPLAALLGQWFMGIVIFMFAMVAFTSDVKRILGRFSTVLILARYHGVPATGAAILAARTARLQDIVMADAKGEPLAESEADRLWARHEDMSVVRNGKDLETYLKDEPERISVPMAILWICAYAACGFGLWQGIVAADGVMSLRETWGVLLHH